MFRECQNCQERRAQRNVWPRRKKQKASTGEDGETTNRKGPGDLNRNSTQDLRGPQVLHVPSHYTRKLTSWSECSLTYPAVGCERCNNFIRLRNHHLLGTHHKSVMAPHKLSFERRQSWPNIISEMALREANDSFLNSI